MKPSHRICRIALSLLTLAGCAAESPSDLSNPDTAGLVPTAQSSNKVCYSGVGVRPSQQPTPTAAVQALWDAWQAAMADYQQAAAAFSVEAQEHADEFQAAAGGVAGTQCTTDLDCDTHSVDFVGSCHVYYNVGQCNIIDQHPLPTGPVAPPQPSLSCADFTCNANFVCEQEVQTTGIACVLQSCGNGGGGGGGGGGGHG